MTWTSSSNRSKYAHVGLPDGSWIDAALATTYWQQLKGLRFQSSGTMLFQLDGSAPLVDSFFMTRPVHLYFLDEDCDVVETALLRPWSFYRPNSDAAYLLESFEDLGLEKDDELTLSQVAEFSQDCCRERVFRATR